MASEPCDTCKARGEEGCFCILPWMSWFGPIQALCGENPLFSETSTWDRGKLPVTTPEHPRSRTSCRTSSVNTSHDFPQIAGKGYFSSLQNGIPRFLSLWG